MDYKAIIFEKEQDIGVITFNRPEAKNSVDLEIMKEVIHCFKAMDADPDIGAVVITGGPKVFSAGFHMPLAISLHDDLALKNDVIESAGEAFTAIAKFRAPVIAAVSGPALAAGFDLQVMADIRVYSETAKVGQVEIDVAVTQLMDPLWKIIGLGRTKELIMTGRVYGAEEAYRIGLANFVYPVETFLDEAKKLAHQLAAKDRATLEATKEQSNRIPGMEFNQAVRTQLLMFKTFVGGDEMVKRMTYFLNKSKK